MDIEAELRNFLGERQLLVEAIKREFRSGTSAMEIARAVAPAFGRDQVKQFLANVAIADSARKALAEAGLSAVVDAVVSGIDAPRQAVLAATADPAEVEEFETLPQRVREALRDFHLTLDLPLGEEYEIPEDGELGRFVDRLLLDGESVRLVKIKPRT